MNARLRWGLGMTALAALAASCLGVFGYHFTDGLRDWNSVWKLWLFAAPPAILAASGSSWWLLRRPAFIRREVWLQTVLVTGLAYLLYVFLFAAWMLVLVLLESGVDGLQNDGESLPLLIVFTAAVVAFAMLLGTLPALLIEYRVLKAMHRRWPAPAAGSSSGRAHA